MADYAGKDGGGIYPSRRSLANKTQLADRTITKAIGELLDGGYIAITRYGNGTPNTYAMLLDSSVYIPVSNHGTWYESRTRYERSTKGQRKGKPRAPRTTPKASSTRGGRYDVPPNRYDNPPLTGEQENVASDLGNPYRAIEDHVYVDSLPVLRWDVDELSEWTWPLEIFDDSKPFRENPNYKDWTERQLRTECKEVPMSFDLYCWKIERGIIYPGQTEGYVPLKGDIGGDE